MLARSGRGSPRSSFLTVLLVLAMLAAPAAFTLHRVHVSAVVDVASPHSSPYGYTASLTLFIVPILVIGGWLVPRDEIRISRKSFLITMSLLIPLGVLLDFFFVHRFLSFPNPAATLGIPAPALGPCSNCHVFVGTPDHVIVGSVPIEEYIFYFTGFITVLLLYIWLDEYWLCAYSVDSTDVLRTNFYRLLRFHPESLMWAVVLISGSIACRHLYDYRHHGAEGFPGYFLFLVIASLGPSTALFPAAMPVVNWRAFSLVMFLMLLTSLLWEATLGVPYGWWDYQPSEMMGIFINAWGRLPIEAVCVWLAVSFQTIIVYEIVKRWQSSGRKARYAFLGSAHRSVASPKNPIGPT
jgi:hypothetical protein